ncbi:MAG: GNAT family N-acetyltransferase [Sedimentisphaerales bacterium]|nr:GNAT family N-acetyltransferase [Sedimentisphaerales bacterium]
MRVRVITALDDIVCLQSRWDKLVQSERLDISATFDWAMALLESHLDNKGLTVVTVEDDAGTLQGIFPFYVKQKTVRKLPVNVICPIAQLFCIHHDLLIRSGRHDVLKIMIDQLNNIPGVKGWNTIEVPEVECGSSTDCVLSELSKTYKYNSIVCKGSLSPFIKMDGISWDEYFASINKKFRSNFKRKQKNFDESGKAEIQKVDHIADRLNVIDAIESKSWKHKNLSAIDDVDEQKKFYEYLMNKYGKQFLFFTLLFDGKYVSYTMGLLFNRKYYSLKTSYDETFRKLSPGIVLRLKLLQYCFDNKLLEFDFCGKNEPWKMEFTEVLRNHNNYIIYNNNIYSRILYAVSRFPARGEKAA